MKLRIYSQPAWVVALLMAAAFLAGWLALASSAYGFGVPNDIWKTPTDYIPPRMELSSENPFEDLVVNWESRCSIPCHCFLFDSRAFREHGIRFSEELPNHEDWDCWMQVFILPVSYHHVRERLAIYRLSPDSMSRQSKEMRRGFILAIKRQMILQPATLRPLLKRKKRKSRRFTAIAHRGPESDGYCPTPVPDMYGAR